MQPVNRFFIGTVKCFGNTYVKFRGFCQHEWSRRESGEERWWWWWWWKREKRGSNNGGGGQWSGDPGDREGGRKVMGKYADFIFFLGS